MIEKKVGDYTLMLNEEVDKDTNCMACSHQFVCKGSRNDFCVNFHSTKTIQEVGHYGPCLNCDNREKKWKSGAWCFKCRHFIQMEN